MGRKTRRKWVKEPPNNIYFSDIPQNKENYIILTLSEFEAMRLKHYMNLNQQVSAESMGISQPTFSRVLENAHKKTIQALIEGKTLRVYGGNFDFKKPFIGYGCLECNNEWEDVSATKSRKTTCPKCNSSKVYYLLRENV
ncbi:MAG: DUF134 domain-containing protein [Candidatus Lokiarchaeota archaeon]|nr:DUF134 domain-containing protein [Candidatus Lokiarchaeota archaeon]